MLNHILGALSPEDQALLVPELESVELEARQELETPNRPIKYVYFLETGIAAVLSISGRLRIALGLIGCEGASGLAVFLGDLRSPHSTIMLTPGTGYRIAEAALRIQMNGHPELTRLLLRYSLAFFNQTAHTALSNASSSIEQRVARWVLMTNDRFTDDEVPLTHEVIAFMLGIRRAGVTVAMDGLAHRKLIHIERGAIRILDRQAIQEIVGAFYGLPEKEYVRLVGTFWPPVPKDETSH